MYILCSFKTLTCTCSYLETNTTTCTCKLLHKKVVECTSLTMFINLYYQWDFLLDKERPEKSNFLPIKRMILHTDLPQSFTSSVHWHVEANYILVPFILKRKQWSWKALYGDSRTTCTKPWQVYLVLLPTHNGIVNITNYIVFFERDFTMFFCSKVQNNCKNMNSVQQQCKHHH